MLVCAVCSSGLLSNIPSAELRSKLDAPSGKSAATAEQQNMAQAVDVILVLTSKHAWSGWQLGVIDRTVQLLVCTASGDWLRQYVGDMVLRMLCPALLQVLKTWCS